MLLYPVGCTRAEHKSLFPSHMKSVGVRGCAWRNLGFSHSFCKGWTLWVVRSYIQIGNKRSLHGCKALPWASRSPAAIQAGPAWLGVALQESPWGLGQQEEGSPQHWGQQHPGWHEPGHGQEIEAEISPPCSALLRSHLDAVFSFGHQHWQTWARPAEGCRRWETMDKNWNRRCSDWM